jgi:hypothetical protein
MNCRNGIACALFLFWPWCAHAQISDDAKSKSNTENKDKALPGVAATHEKAGEDAAGKQKPQEGPAFKPAHKEPNKDKKPKPDPPVAS